MYYDREDACTAWLSFGRLPYAGLRKLWEDYGSAEAIYEVFAENAAALEAYAPAASIAALRAHGTQEAMHRMLLKMQKHRMRVMTLDHPAYPALLKEIADPPVILFYQGELDCLSRRCITMVGSRSASPHGLQTAHDVAADFARKGVTVVSGFAQGIDRASHEGCLDAGGRTAAVMACGLDVDYPLDSMDFRERILSQGGVTLSEYPPGDRVQRWNFAVRNRILSGLSAGTVMMECQPRSGSMLTVQHALDQGREVFAYPGQAGTPASTGAHMLLREGATYFAFAEDVMSDLGWDKPSGRAVRRPTAAPPALPPMSAEQKCVYDALAGGECSFDQLASVTGMDAPTLSGALTILQLLGLIQPMPGKMYARV